MQKPSQDTLLLVACAGVALLFLSWLYPPRMVAISSPPGVLHTSAGFRWVLTPDEIWSDDRTFRIDSAGLAGIDLAIAAITASAIFSIRFERK